MQIHLILYFRCKEMTVQVYQLRKLLKVQIMEVRPDILTEDFLFLFE